MSAPGIAAIYARFSSHNQRDESIEIQVENCRRYCDEHGLAVLREYTDYAQTGRDTNRSGLRRMVADAEAGLFDCVVIYKVTRIMRNRDEMAALRIRLRRAGVTILYAGEQIGGGSSGVLQLGMLEVLAEWESAILAERVRDGIRKNAERCMANGQPLFGWDIGEDGRYVVNEHEAEALRLARDVVVGGGSVADAVRALSPWRTRRGKPIRQQTLTNMLRRRQNCGTFSYAGVVVEGGMPALWSRAEQDRLEDALDMGGHARRGEGRAWFPLTGRLLHVHADGACHRMRGWGGTSRDGTVHRYYQCRDCRATVRKADAEAAVSGAVADALRDPGARDLVTALVLEAEAESEGPTLSEAIEAELAEVRAGYSRFLDAIERGIEVPGMAQRIDSLREREAALVAELAEARAVEGVRIDADSVAFWLEEAADMPMDEVCATFVGRAWLMQDGSYRVACMFEDEPPPDGPPDAPVFRHSQAGATMLEAHEHTGSCVRILRRGFVVSAR